MKRRLKFAFRIPACPAGRGARMAWRERVNRAAHRAAQIAGVEYAPTDRLEVVIRLYLEASLLASSDVDNWAKHVLDALQGRGGGSKRIQTFDPLIPNDRQVHRLVIEKALPPWQSWGLGHVLIRGLRRPTRKRK